MCHEAKRYIEHIILVFRFSPGKSEGEKTRLVEKHYVGSPSKQCTSLERFSIKKLLVDKRVPLPEHYIPVFIRFSTRWLISVSETENCFERNSCLNRRRVNIKAADQLKDLTFDDLQYYFGQWKTRMRQFIDRGEYTVGHHN